MAFGSDENATNVEAQVSEELSEILNTKRICVFESEEVTMESRNVSSGSETDLWSHFDQKVFKKKTSSTPTSTVFFNGKTVFGNKTI